MTQNQINYWNLVEQRRANMAKEAENVRHNVTTEGLDLAKNKETKRHNIAQENLNYLGVVESQRHNVKSEELSASSINVSRSNVQLGYGQLGLGYAQLGEASRHNIAQETETQTNNETLSAIKAYESDTARMKMQYDYQIEKNKLAQNAQNLDIKEEANYINSWSAGAKAAGTLINVIGLLLK